MQTKLAHIERILMKDVVIEHHAAGVIFHQDRAMQKTDAKSERPILCASVFHNNFQILFIADSFIKNSLFGQS